MLSNTDEMPISRATTWYEEQYVNFQEMANQVDATSVKIEGSTVYWTETFDLGITDDQVIYMVCQKMEVDQVMNWERQTNSDAFWEAAQEILDAAELVAVAGAAVFAPEVVGTAATIGTVTEIANTGISIYREDYDDAVIRAAGVIADVLPVGKAIDKVSDGGEVIIRSKSGEAIEIITEKGGKKQVEKIAYDIGDDIIDSSGKAARQVTPNIERTSLEEASDLVGDNVPPHMTEYSSTITKLDDATNRIGINSKSSINPNNKKIIPPNQVNGGKFNVEVPPARFIGDDPVSDAHNITVKIIDENGNITNVWREVSGNATESEKALGVGLMRQATHTEQRALTRINLTNETVLITGQNPPCKNCQGAMRQATLNNNATIIYQWRECGKTVQAIWKGGKKIKN